MQINLLSLTSIFISHSVNIFYWFYIKSISKMWSFPTTSTSNPYVKLKILLYSTEYPISTKIMFPLQLKLGSITLLLKTTQYFPTYPVKNPKTIWATHPQINCSLLPLWLHLLWSSMFPCSLHFSHFGFLESLDISSFLPFLDFCICSTTF